MRLSSTLARTVSKKLSLAVLALTFLMSGFAPALTSAVYGGPDDGRPVAPKPSNYCGADPAPLKKTPPDTSQMSEAKAKKAQEAYQLLVDKRNAKIPSCIVLYSAQDKYSTAVIRIAKYTNQPTGYKQALCANKPFVNSKGKTQDITVKLTAKQPKVVNCSAANYYVYYLKKGQAAPKTGQMGSSKSYISTSLQRYNCNYVRTDQAVEVQPLEDTTNCPMGTTEKADPADKSTSALALTFANDPAWVTPNLISRGQKMFYTVELSSTDSEADPMTFQDCAAPVAMTSTITTADGKISVKKQNVSLRLSHQKGTCLYRYSQSAKQNSIKNGTYSGQTKQVVEVTFQGNKLQNPVKTTTTVTFTDKPVTAPSPTTPPSTAPTTDPDPVQDPVN